MSSRSLGSLTLDLIARVGGFRDGMDQAARIAAERLAEMERRAYRFGEAIGTAMKAGVAVISTQVVAATAAIGVAINRMDDLSKAALRAQLPIEDFVEFEYAGRLADVAMTDLVSSFGRLAKAQVEALDGTGKQAEAFKQLGISVKNSDGTLKRGKDLIYEFADAFKNAKDSPKTMSAGMAIFGKSFQTLIPLLKDGSDGLRGAAEEARALNLVFDQESADSAEAFNDNLSRMQEALSGLAIVAASEVLPKLVDLTDKVVDWVKESENATKIADSFALAFDIVSIAVDALSGVWAILTVNIASSVQVFMGAYQALIGVGEAMSNIFTFGAAPGSVSGGIGKVSNAVSTTAGLIKSNMDDAAASVKKNVESILATINGTGKSNARTKGNRSENPLDPDTGGGGGGGPSAVDKNTEAYKRLIASMNERIALFGLEGEAAKVRYQTEFGDLVKLSEQQKANLIDAAEMYDSIVADDKARKELTKTIDAQHDAELRQKELIESLLSDLEFENKIMQLSNSQREIEIELRRANVEAMSEEGRLISEAIIRNQELGKSIDYQIDALDSIRGAGADFFSDYISGAKGLKDAFGSALDSIHSRILQMIAENLMSKLFGQNGQPGGGGFGNVLGSIFGSFFGGGLASGGPVRPNSMYEVNEFGSEVLTMGGRDYLMTGSKGGFVNPSSRSGSGGYNQTVNLQVQGKMDRRTEEQIARAIGRESQRGLVRTGS